MKRVIFGLLTVTGLLVAAVQPVGALSSDPKVFVSADNTFYAYVKAGETLSAAFLRVNQNEPFNTVRGDVTITIDGPGAEQQRCVASRDVPIGQGCRFAAVTAQKSGIWRIQFSAPSEARTYQEVSPVVKWGGNLFSWDITVRSGSTEQKGRIWTERYAIRQPAPVSFSTDLVTHYISEDGYIYRATHKGYNGQISTLSADGIGIRTGDKCTSVYQSTEVSDTKFTPALGACGSGYKLFLEAPAGDLPQKAEQWDGKQTWVRPSISRPEIAELNFTSDNSSDQQSGSIAFFLRNFIGQYQIKVDVDNNGAFDDQNDVVIHQQMKQLSSGLQKVRFDGVDKVGQIISPSQPIGIKVEITKVAEIHLVAADVEGRNGGLEITRLNGDAAPTSRMCWNDTELAPLAGNLTTKVIDGRDCPDSSGGVHGWEYSDGTWGNARYIDDWAFASAKLQGTNQIVFPEEVSMVAASDGNRNTVAIVIGIVAAILATGGIILLLLHRRQKQRQGTLIQQLPHQPSPADPSQLPPTYDGNPKE